MRPRASSTVIMTRRVWTTSSAQAYAAGEILAEADHQASSRALHTVHTLDAVGDRPSQLVEVLGFKQRDNIVRAGHGVHRDHARLRQVQFLTPLAHSISLAHGRFDQYVSPHLSAS